MQNTKYFPFHYRKPWKPDLDAVTKMSLRILCHKHPSARKVTGVFYKTLYLLVRSFFLFKFPFVCNIQKQNGVTWTSQQPTRQYKWQIWFITASQISRSKHSYVSLVKRKPVNSKYSAKIYHILPGSGVENNFCHQNMLYFKTHTILKTKQLLFYCRYCTDFVLMSW